MAIKNNLTVTRGRGEKYNGEKKEQGRQGTGKGPIQQGWRED